MLGFSGVEVDDELDGVVEWLVELSVELEVPSVGLSTLGVPSVGLSVGLSPFVVSSPGCSGCGVSGVPAPGCSGCGVSGVPSPGCSDCGFPGVSSTFGFVPRLTTRVTGSVVFVVGSFAVTTPVSGLISYVVVLTVSPLTPAVTSLSSPSGIELSSS